MAGGDDVVTVGLTVDRIDVQQVDRATVRRRRRDRSVAGTMVVSVDVEVILAVPVEHQRSGRRQLLDVAVERRVVGDNVMPGAATGCAGSTGARCT